MYNCYLCESPIERGDDSELGVFVACSEKEQHHILCSTCTKVVQEIKNQLRKVGRVLIVQTVEGIVAVDQRDQ